MIKILQILLSYLLALSGIGLNLSGNTLINFHNFTTSTNTGVVEIGKPDSTSPEIQPTPIQAEALTKIELFDFRFGDVTAEIIGNDIDNNGNIRVKTQYKIDGVEVKSNYPPLDGKYYWVTRYSAQSFVEMTALQIEQKIAKDMQDFAQVLMRRKK